MKSRALKIIGVLFVLALTARLDGASPTPEAKATVVVYNSADPDSASLAKYYAGKRGIPSAQVVGFDLPIIEEIDRATFEVGLFSPLRARFTKNGWWRVDNKGRVLENRIRFVALIRGVPLKVSGTPVIAGTKPDPQPPQIWTHNEASVDSEIAVLGDPAPERNGMLANPAYQSLTPVLQGLYPQMLFVARLDAREPATVRRMIDDSLSAEATGLCGTAYVDSRNLRDGGYVEGDDWMRKLAAALLRKGIPVILDQQPDLFPAGYPMPDAALYYGWYRESVARPFSDQAFRFRPGAIAVHLHSFSASTLRVQRRNWCAPLLDAGAAATLGNVYEPYLQFTSHLDIFNDRLLAGFSLAESGWMSMPTLSWMGVFIGDPLYRPFRARGSSAEADAKWKLISHAIRDWFDGSVPAARETLQKAASTENTDPLFALGLLEQNAGRIESALAAWKKAVSLEKTSPGKLRYLLLQVELLRGNGRKEEALAIIRKALREQFDASSDAWGTLREVEYQIDPPQKPTQAPPATQ